MEGEIRRLRMPLSEADALSLRAGGMVLLDGEITITAGLPTHHRIVEVAEGRRDGAPSYEVEDFQAISDAIRAVVSVDWNDLVSHYRLVTLRVEGLGPLTVGIDAHGNSLYGSLSETAAARMPAPQCRRPLPPPP